MSLHEAVIITAGHWSRWVQEGYTVLPYIAEYEWGHEALPSWLPVWEDAGSHAAVLESGKDGRYTYLACKPVSVITGKDREAFIQEGDKPSRREEGDPLQLLKRWMSPYRAPKVEGMPKFIGGCIGYLSYDVARSLERMPESAADDLELPDYVFVQMDELWIVDKQERRLYCAVMTRWPDGNTGQVAAGAALAVKYEVAASRAQAMKAQWDEWQERGSASFGPGQAASSLSVHGDDLQTMDIEAFEGVASAFPKEEFKDAVRRIQHYIGQGDVFQVNLSMRQSRRLRETPERLYEWLRALNPSPYMGLLRFPEFQLVSCSPQLLVRLEQGSVSTRPIAGTRRRGRTPEEDARLAEELRTNEKECAEHIMLVDLERNDLGRISAYGSVRVDELMVIETYSHVMHLVSEVRGTLAEGKAAFDVIQATFPGGTITGAPKVRTMEIIEELEPIRRGPYTGSFGWIDYNGDLELNIIIRTLVVKDQIGYIQAGAGIVIDSDPEREYAECLNKAKALWKAVQLSESVPANAIPPGETEAEADEARGAVQDDSGH
ncbi:anthranilate synthase component I family protein [Paenibacillus thiaminolyticus]|uniref:anthranilate synthase component I family protein n=1 Tax=Paenibacillus thiaminolyticus TaxID=49283 RepID=UPI0023507C31|nr:anthranilate synthase component I family protein [Paenibacillus thiaminolyticus]WCR30065.1 anthranilate synthase component I family protein [Paenibacillus thiaminolyticus]